MNDVEGVEGRTLGKLRVRVTDYGTCAIEAKMDLLSYLLRLAEKYEYAIASLEQRSRYLIDSTNDLEDCDRRNNCIISRAKEAKGQARRFSAKLLEIVLCGI